MVPLELWPSVAERMKTSTPTAELNEWHGCCGKGEDDSVRHRDATELLKLIQLLLETWGNVIKICRMFGVLS